ncbi:PH domain-containing protein [Jeotgalibacillus sp. ET6]|uniref:PH domain-containing protein n=1 Tax=Jeotgalibacillus sp. ET6 TaxID=3037260 RepID=UPI002418609B|nr:PH domain-containing protein [Jeotgalibacillus sp. ET6]MDG5472830.1 PH domain-containing protein [Jeotgalibacillus sp. ET6]
MSEEKRLHPVSAVINFVKALKEALIPLVVLVFLNQGDRDSLLDYLPFVGMGVFMIIILFVGILKWWRFTYRVEEGELRIEYGLFVKKKRYIPFERIQSLNYSEGILHRPLKLVKIKVETAGSSNSLESEAELTAITKEEANELNSFIAKAKKKLKESGAVDENGLPIEEPAEEEKEAEGKVLYKMSVKDLVIMATTSGGAGVVISGILIFLSQFSEFIPFETVADEFLEVVQSGVLFVAVMIFLVLFFAWVIAVAMTFIRYASFTVRLVEKDLIITRGLLEKKQTTIPLNRIQGIRFNQNLLREPFKYASVTIESAGGSALEKDSNTIRLLPMIRSAEAPKILEEILPEYEWSTDFTGAPKRSIFRYMFWNLFFISFVIAPVSYFFYPLGLLSLLLYPIMAGLSWLQYKNAGYRLSEDQLTMQYRVFDKQIVYLKKKRIQSLELKETWFQRKGRVATLSATIKSYLAGSENTVKHLDVKDVEKVMEWYQPEGSRAAKQSEPLQEE